MFLDELLNELYDIFLYYKHEDLSSDDIDLLDKRFKEIINDLCYIRNSIILTPERIAKFNFSNIKILVFSGKFNE